MSPTDVTKRRGRRPRPEKPHGRKVRRSPAALALPWAARVILLAVIVLMPWAYGGVLGSTLIYAIAGVMVAMACWLVSNVIEPQLKFPISTAVVVLLGAILLGIVQFMPNPRTFDNLGIPEVTMAQQPPSSTGKEHHVEWSESHPADRFPLRTLNPAGTKHDLVLLVLATSVFFLSVRLFHSHTAFRWACLAVAASGGAIGFFSIAQLLAGTRRILWLANTGAVGSPFGPFVNRNSGGGYMNLCLAAGLGYLFWSFTKPREKHTHHRHRKLGNTAAAIALMEFDAVTPHEPHRAAKAARFLGGIGAMQLWAIALVALLIASTVASLSRGAIVSMALGLGAVSILLIATFRRTAPVFGIAIIGVLALVLAGSFGVTNLAEKRLAAAAADLAPNTGRIGHWNDALKAVMPSWFLGNGLGSHRQIYRPFQDRPGTEWYYHAENQYLEALVDAGVVGLFLMLATLAIVGASLWLVIRRGAKRNLVFTLVATFALVTQSLHAFVDFGLYVPSNALLLALICGAIVGKGLSMPNRKGFAQFLGFSLPRLFPIAVVIGLVQLVGLSWAAIETTRFAATEEAQRTLVLKDLSDQTPRIEVDRAIRRLEDAVRNRWYDAEAQQCLGELYLHAYRLRRVEQLRALSSGDDAKQETWRLTDPAVLHKQAVTATLAGNDATVEQLRGDILATQWLRKAYDRFDLASQACALIGAVHLRKAELCFLYGDPLADRIHLQRAQRLSSGNHAIQYRAGLLHWNADRIDAALDCWRRSLELSWEFEALIFTFGLERLSPAELNAKLLPDLPQVLFHFARRLKDAKRPESEYRPIFERAQKVLGTYKGLAGPERLYLEAQVLVENGKYDEAIQAYQNALLSKPDNVAWHYELAELCLRQGLVMEAHEHAKIYARTYPNDRTGLELLKVINKKITIPGGIDSKPN